MPGRNKRGFAAMSPEKQREIASKGGQAAHRKGTAHEFTPEEAREAGRLGGKTVGENRAHMAAIGRKGGQRAASSLRRSLHSHGTEENGRHLSQRIGPRATDLLRADHRQIGELFRQQGLSHEQDDARVSLVYQICADLEVHAQLEEELFYPAVKAKADASFGEKIDGAIKEHQRMKDLIVQLRHMAVDDAAFAPTVQRLRECVEHHVEEEERVVMPVAEEQCEEELPRLGAQIQQRKQDLLGESDANPPLPEYSEQVVPKETSRPHEFSVGPSH
jgi:general stress protein YciG/hemerythrin-like domain-containing protein